MTGAGENRIWNAPANAVRICIDRYAEDIGGRIYSRMKPEPLLFGNCCEMLLKTDSMFDEKGYPQAFKEKRNFFEKRPANTYCAVPELLLDKEELCRQRGACGTVDVIVQSRRRAGWQGIMLRTDGRKMGIFRSEMELLKCIYTEMSG